ncbi:hypothetical protein ACIBQX_11240 [Nonomuraea sp. NPDC049714]|uniref:hypothetical protein n=1 Tax=Nonomuraea sp. NPDC049714 TaxID=3364357 RepID=UPI00378E5416
MDKYPGDVLADIRKLQAEVAELKALLHQRSGLTTASQGWVIGNVASPSTPAAGGHLFATAGEPFWKDSSGTTTSLLSQPVPQAADVGGMSGLSTPNSWPETYNRANGEAVQDDLTMLRTFGLDLRAALRAVGLMA